jgi:hypothetical protein
MQDFNEYSKSQSSSNSKQSSDDMFSDVMNVARQFDGKSQKELLTAIYQKAREGKKNGTLTNEQIDAFSRMLYPMFDEKQRKVLDKVVAELKKL